MQCTACLYLNFNLIDNMDIPHEASLREFYSCLDQPIHPASLRRIFTLLLRQHYIDTAHYGDMSDELGCLRWSPNPQESSLNIEVSRVFEDHEDITDGIFVDVGDMTFSKQVINNQAQISADNSGITYATRASCPVIISHVRDTVDKSYALATETAMFMFAIRDNLSRAIGLSSLDISKLGKANQTSGDKNPLRDFTVDLILSLSFNFAMIAKYEGHRLKKFGLSVIAEAG